MKIEREKDPTPDEIDKAYTNMQRQEVRNELLVSRAKDDLFNKQLGLKGLTVKQVKRKHSLQRCVSFVLNGDEEKHFTIKTQVKEFRGS